MTSVGRVFHTYGANKLGLLSVSKIHPEDITALAAGKYFLDHVFFVLWPRVFCLTDHVLSCFFIHVFFFIDAYLVFAAAGRKVYAWRRGTELKHIYHQEDDGHTAPVIKSGHSIDSHTAPSTHFA